MTSNTYNLVKYTADEGFVFDWAEPHFHTDEEGNQVEEHLYSKVIFLGANDSIDNYIEVESK